MQLLNIDQIQQVSGGCDSYLNVFVTTQMPWSVAAQIMTDLINADNDIDIEEDLGSIAKISDTFKQANIDPLIDISFSFSTNM